MYEYMVLMMPKKQERDILSELNCQILSQQLLGKHLQIFWEFISKREKFLCKLHWSL